MTPERVFQQPVRWRPPLMGFLKHAQYAHEDQPQAAEDEKEQAERTAAQKIHPVQAIRDESPVKNEEVGHKQSPLVTAPEQAHQAETESQNHLPQGNTECRSSEISQDAIDIFHDAHSIVSN
ncbi:hypothetical protein COW98_03090 [Candidatus Roizmanbacteria bacterium CG22_combo_CG10-13_8_21_14_all_35_9]|uniref:Uncharacterized protein n=1 Tax=Candidatus Roizmanbacteria bacterium CG22_combo_CG10-13_8_21_14_all_35_9 TaxID=1974861 RepID=A0A2H0BY58_9BACT|nr:MAG: hypothetical protein COW98_03090 [Candidatus Roizmanbacteria bacterium CG22_combo_CG10-13_8_21_14_all_35_9]